MKVDGSLRSLLQGVSQQPPRDRLPGQCTEQINMSSDPVQGLTRRAPTDLIAELVTVNNMRAWHAFDAAGGEQFIAAFHGNTVKVWDYAGNPKTVAVDAASAAYLAQPGDLTFATIEDQVVVANKGVTCEMIAGNKSFANKGVGSSPMGIVQVLGGQYGREYRISMNGSTIAMYKPPNGSESAMVDYIRTTLIAQRLFQGMTEAAGDTADIDGAGSFLHRTGALSGANWTVTRFEDMILIRNNVATEFKLSASDDAGNVNLKTCTDQVADVADVPRMAPSGYLLRVATETDPNEDLFLEFKRADGADTPGTGFGNVGYWQETVSADVYWQMNRPTLPHILEYDPTTNEFKFRPGNWRHRLVGTDTSNPPPSFINAPITAVTTFQSRLVFLSGSYVCMSRTNRYEDFWMGSAANLVDSDPIDISSTAVEASVMEEAIPHNRDMVVFSKKGQFVVFGRSALTPANATLVLTTAFEAALQAKPVPSGRNVFFATNYGRYTGIREFFTESATDINDTRPATQHVKEYLKGRVRHMAASSNYDILLVATEGQRNALYVYQYIWDDKDKIQSSWSRWEFPDSVEYFFFDEEQVYMVCGHKYENDTMYFLMRMSLDIQDEPGMSYSPCLDHRFNIKDCYTEFLLPWDSLGDHDFIVVQGLDCPNPGMTVPVQSVERSANDSAYKVTLKYNMLGGNLVCGVPYMSMYRPTMPMVKDGDGVVIATAKVRAKHFIVSLDRTGHIVGQMMSKYGNGEPVEFQGRIVGDPDNRVGVPALSDENFIMPFRERTDRADFILYTDRHLPMNLLDIEWVGQYSKRGRRIGGGGGES